MIIMQTDIERVNNCIKKIYLNWPPRGFLPLMNGFFIKKFIF